MSDRVLAAASAQLCLVGADALTVDAIADRARVSVGFVYSQFRSLDEIIRTVLARDFARLCDAIPATDPIPAALLAPTNASPERLILEGLLALRRFPHVHDLVQPTMETLVERVGPLRTAVIVGCQAVTVAGVTIPDADLTSLIGLEARIRADTDSPSIPSAARVPDGETTVPHPGPEYRDDTARRLQDATSDLLAETGGRATMRDIARRAGVTTGAVYRRYQSKDDLISDTISARVTKERTGWMQELFAALMNPEQMDPALVLARVLADSCAPDERATQESIELVVAARSGPAARSVLTERFRIAVKTRTSQLERLLDADLMSHPDSPTSLAWAFQVAPTGARIAGLGVPMPRADGWYPSMAALLRSL
jgi:AcrR family transcriptional regulator